jgi:hypothetical protein
MASLRPDLRRPLLPWKTSFPRRVLEFREIAAAVVFLASDESALTVGANWRSMAEWTYVSAVFGFAAR